MNTIQAFANGEANRHKELMVFDWDKAARLIKDRNPKEASASLADDWEYTGGTIYEDGKTVKEYTHLASTWATPKIDIDGDISDCFKMQSEVPDWDASTKWPESALDILNN